MLTLSGITKKYGSFKALDRVDFQVGPGEIVGLLGENGAGKSTLLSIVSGNQLPTKGEIKWRGEAVQLASPRDAAQLGIGVVHQHFKLVPAFTIAENIALQSSDSSPLFREKEWQTQIIEWAKRIDWQLDPTKKVGELSVGERQRVEILKALFVRDEVNGGPNNAHTAQLLLLDEPTTNLTPYEVEELFGVLRQLREQGCAIVFVSHKLKEVSSLCDRAVILRRGRLVGERPIAGSSTDELAEMMVGHALSPPSPMTIENRSSIEPEGFCLEIENLSLGILHDFSLRVRRGEVVGIAGVDGNGQTELLEALSGLRKAESGSLNPTNTALALIPADRQSVGLIPDFTLFENFALHPALRRECRTRTGFNWKKVKDRARELMKKFDVRAPEEQERATARQLSGGNQQKLVIARALSFPHQVVLASDPTRGLDIAATRFVHQQLQEAALAGAGVLLVSTDLDEIFALSHRIGVLYNGRLLPENSEELLPGNASRETVGALMGGMSQSSA